MTTLESNRCYACNKLFCCVDCCILHIKKKHPGRESKCPLCRRSELMVKNFDNQQFLCHVVFNHLPLGCRLCGESFKNCDDLKNLAVCNRRPFNVASAIQEDPNESLLSPETYSAFNKTPSGQSGIKRSEYSIDGDYNGNFRSFTSPPELSRHTSTPMHTNIVGSSVNFAFKTPRSPNFSLKTPKATNHSVKNVRRNERSATNENSIPRETDCENAESPTAESNYLSLSALTKSSVFDRTPLRSILSNRSSSYDNNTQEFSGGRKLAAMQELNEEVGIEEMGTMGTMAMELTEAHGGLILSSESPIISAYDNVSQRRDKSHRDSAKRVRFSDQFEMKSETEVPSAVNFDGTEGEEFFEARQSLSEMSIAVVEKLSTSSVLIDRENEKNAEKEKTEIVEAEIKNSERDESREESSVATSSSSRVVMMVVVERNGSLNTADLAPLINSSLKKLEGVATSSTAPKDNSMEPLPLVDQDRTPGTTVVSVDSYMSVSTVECYSTPDSTVAVPQSPRESQSNSGAGNGGIFSAMAHAMRLAFRNLAGASSSRNISREHVSQKETPALLSSTPESNVGSSAVLESLATALVPRTGKRSRDAEELLSIQPSESVDLQNDIRSPLPKRPRGWYKIRAREPIARMRNDNNSVTSPRGVSSETQCFQQGSLSVGDTILPIPSRAHQSTQTD